GANSSSAHLWIVQFIRCAFIFSLRRAIELPWTTHPKGFVRPLVVKYLPPQIEAPLIGLPQGLISATDLRPLAIGRHFVAPSLYNRMSSSSIGRWSPTSRKTSQSW